MLWEIGLPLSTADDSFSGASSDADLIQACQRGELSAFEEIYTLHASRMKSIAAHLLRNRSDAEDAVQDSFLKIYRAVGGFDQGAPLKPWIYRILINCCYDLGRKRKRQAEAELEHEPTVAGDAPLKVALHRALARIHPAYRTVFWLFEAEGFRHSEIATILEIPEGTSKKYLFEAKRALKQMLLETKS
jgi:RNA polymerase sigma-70 factor (ECF subfamily)